MDTKQYISSGILEQYVLGLCSPEEAKEVCANASAYPEIAKKIKKLQCCMEHYADLHAIPPPSNLKNKILSDIDDWEECKALSVEYKRGEEQAPQLPARNYNRLFAGIAALMIFSLSMLSYSLYQKQNAATEQLQRLSSEFNSIKLDHQALKKQSNRLQSQYAVLKDVGTKHVHLRGSKMVPQALAVIYYNPDHKKTYLNIVNLPDPPNDHQYQLWADINGKHHNMGAVQVGNSGEALRTMPFMENSKGFAITLEAKTNREIKAPTVTKTCLSGSL